MKSQANKPCKVNKLDGASTQKTTTWQYKPLVSAVLAGMVATMLPLSVSNPVLASELDVYENGGAENPKPPSPDTEGGPKLMLMLSTNATMGCHSIAFDYPELNALGTYTAPISAGGGTQVVSTLTCDEKQKTISVGGQSFTYTEYSYTKNGQTYLSRKDRALLGLLDLLDHPEQLPKNTSLGLSFYGFDQGQADAFFNINQEFDALLYHKKDRYDKAMQGKFFKEGTTQSARTVGIIQVPISPLQKPDGSFDQAFINRLKEQAIRMVPASNYSPVGSGYAEGVAYMLGSSTFDRDNKFASSDKKTYPIRYNTFYNEFQMCLRFAPSGLCKDNADSWVPLVSPWKEKYMDLLDKDSNGNPIKVKGSELGLPGRNKDYDYYIYTTIQSSRSEVHALTPSGIQFSAKDTKNDKTDLKSIAYISPMDFGSISSSTTHKNECSVSEYEAGGAYGFYFLTDGLPNAGNYQSYQGGVSGIDARPRVEVIQKQMDNIFKNKDLGGFSCLPNDEQYWGYNDDIRSSKGGLSNKPEQGNQGRSGWNCILAAAKKLQDKNQKKYPTVRTAVAGYGYDYSKGFTGSYKKLENCSEFATTDNKKRDPYLACQWGQKDYGNGGFYIVNDGAGLAKSIVDFANSLVGSKLVTKEYSSQSGDGLTVAADVTDATTSSNFAFLPLMLPRPGSNQILWAGNVNKYKVKNGSLFDKHDKHLYDNVSGQIRLNTTELWNNSGNPDSGVVRTTEIDSTVYQPAGTYAQLTAPDSTSTNSTRTVYVEKANGGIQKIAVTGNKPVNINNLNYDFQKQQYLLNFLGYNVPVFAGGKRITEADYDKTTGVLKDKDNPMDNLSSYVPTEAVKILGGINNSKPQEVLYESVETYDPSTKKTVKTNTSSVLYGSFDGALHLVDGETGKEHFAFIPKPIMTSDRNIAALKDGSTQLADGTDNPTGKIAYGVDAPWYVDILLNRKYDTNKVTYNTNPIEGSAPGHIHAYGGLGRGGMGFYGLNITNKTSPELLFSIDNSKTGFERLGNTWSKPTKAKIQYKDATNTINKDVLFVTGGYDFCFDNPDFKLNTSNTEWKTVEDQTGVSCNNKAKTLGNAVYMIDANDGKLLWTAKLEGSAPSGTSVTDETAKKSAGNPYLKYSIPGEAAVIDTNFDGYVDSIYFADLGGQVFRADFSGEYTQNTGIKSKVTRILDTSSTDTAAVPLRFFQRPVVSAYRFNITKENGVATQITPNDKGTNQVQIVSIASGDRNSPLSKLPTREVGKQTNKLISVWNADKINDTNATEGVAKLSSGSDFLQLDLSKTQDMNVVDKQKLVSGMVKGWYNDLTYFKGNTVQDTGSDRKIQSRTGTLTDAVGENINYLRAFGQPVIKGGRLFVSVYNNQAYIPAPPGTCSPVPTGVTEAQEYCMPFGACSNGRGAIHTLGPGVSSVNFASIDKGSNEFALVTPTEIKKSSSNGSPSAAGSGGKLEEEKGIFASLYDLLPHRWFEKLPLHSKK